MVGICGFIVYSIAYYYGKIQCEQNKVECPSAWGAGEGMLEYFYRQANIQHTITCEEEGEDGSHRRLASTRYGGSYGNKDQQHGVNPLRAHAYRTSEALNPQERYLTAHRDDESEVEILFGKPIGVLVGGISQAMRKAPDLIGNSTSTTALSSVWSWSASAWNGREGADVDVDDWAASDDGEGEEDTSKLGIGQRISASIRRLAGGKQYHPYERPSIAGMAFCMIVIGFIKMMLVAICTSVGGSGGMFAPAIILGGYFGGATGMMLRLVSDYMFNDNDLDSGTYVQLAILFGMVGFF